MFLGFPLNVPPEIPPEELDKILQRFYGELVKRMAL